jgi:RHH-type rel operon transcriptional repressor/antitoxin RelB
MVWFSRPPVRRSIKQPALAPAAGAPKFLPMLTLRLPVPLERQLAREAKRRGRTKPALAREAVVELLQDAHDVREADIIMARVARGEERTVTSAQIKRELGL